MSILQDEALFVPFCPVDDRYKVTLSAPRAKSLSTPGKQTRTRSLCESEIVTLFSDGKCYAFIQRCFRDFNTFYLSFVHP